MQNRPLQPNGTTVLEGLREVAPNASITYNPNAQAISKEDVVVAVVGEYPYAEGFGDDADLRINKADLEVINRVQEAGNPMVVVMLSGRPLMVHEQLEHWDAFVASFLPGMAGEGLADVIFGDYNPQATLGFTWHSSPNGDGVLFKQGSGLNYN